MNSITSFVEWASVITALVYVVLAARASRSCFIFGLISSALLLYICFSDHLYFDSAINAYYVFMSVWGWIRWSKKAENSDISQMGPGSLFFVICTVSLLVALGFGYVFTVYTDASLAYVDSFTTVFAIVATWMMVKKILENWLLWILADGVSILMYAYKEHFPIAFLFLVYTLISFYGYRNWKTLLQRTT